MYLHNKVVLIEDNDEYRNEWKEFFKKNFPQIDLTAIEDGTDLDAKKLASLILDDALFILDNGLWGNSDRGQQIAQGLCSLGYPKEKIAFASSDNANLHLDGWLTLDKGGDSDVLLFLDGKIEVREYDSRTSYRFSRERT